MFSYFETIGLFKRKILILDCNYSKEAMAEAVYRTLDIRPEDRIIAIQENKKANASFILSSILGKCISEQENVCLVLTQNTVAHFHNAGKLLGYDLYKYIQEEKLKSVNLMKHINGIPEKSIDDCVGGFYKEIFQNFEALSKKGATTLIFEDLSRLCDLGLPFKDISMYIRICNMLAGMHGVRVVLTCHIVTKQDTLLKNYLFHLSDLWVIVSALKTGRSRNVTGSLEVKRPPDLMSDTVCSKFYHYNLEERNIKVFAPGKNM